MIQNKLALIALGANLPSAAADVGETLRSAARILHENRNTTITTFSRFWKTPAMPAGSGPDFVNAALTLRTTLSAPDLLALLHDIEARFGRDRGTGRWSARVLDLDLIGYDDLVLPDRNIQQDWMALSPERQKIDTPENLILPHPRLQDRGFVLAPLAEIAPEWIHPVTGQSVTKMLAGLPDEAIRGMTPFTALEMPVLP
ncbi:2-amino-4-hydroxy-6-hydroxymethyldihydropteridine diphosphokinase [Paracoccus saliphilus]|uniref:2-amino-4-hydroxy-6-hydroxymethyldihydropteridine pyrophosphokinase n=1 Tax=Paracoccus saliphilus TaxID=405559 RepID=A0AA45W1V4_9RHOB|nr:2-amino-4-hydroxy-6-hydroxymethyldihydropteridine diphosphokinase [Paracoccus saliphilus]WCR01727.1 2-amino-4-hydroxy-6-hydroxymethyldihydropteridine diphosphokinase [Paracoccus saliphilus]SIS62555.1 2-amino-4-hydroxy-6-hydroxymethyldihydropteridinediphosphokinase [Paracoccus saliphilus]